MIAPISKKSRQDQKNGLIFLPNLEKVKASLN
jgi:hypothetical protein